MADIPVRRPGDGWKVRAESPLYFDMTQAMPNLTPTPLQATIMNANAHFVQAFTACNADAIARCYTQEGCLLPAQGSIITGRPAICAFWQGVLDMGLCCTARTTTDIQVEVTIGHEIGTLHPRLAQRARG